MKKIVILASGNGSNAESIIRYFKPKKNLTNNKPDFYIHETDKWLVFPHELEGLTIDEIEKNKPELADLISDIKKR